ncbi:MAG: acyl-CoA synthetase [Candidatus Marinimicrobia bacterium]|nr:acyl-CoA synthetase [Candidatus Neomarinimicrobiota bacterium]
MQQPTTSSDGIKTLRPTPSETPGLAKRLADFATLTESLNYAAKGETGLNFYSARGELDAILTYRDLSEQAQSHGRRLVAAGIRPGDRIALLAATEPEFLILFFACQYAGIIPLPMPLPTAFGRRESYIDQIKGQMLSSRARMALGPKEFLPLVEEAGADLGLVLIGSLKDLSALPEGAGFLQPGGPEDLSYIQYSSGSTRFPKGVMVTHTNLMKNCSAMNGFGVSNRANDRGVSWLPLFHDMGLVGFVLGAVTSQSSMDYLATENFARRPLTWLKIISENGGALSYAPSFGYELCARRVSSMAKRSLDLDLSSWRVAGIGGEMIKPGVMQAFADVFKPYGFSEKAFCASYGLAECVLAVSFAEGSKGMTLDHVDKQALEDHRAVPILDDGSHDARSFVSCGKIIPEHKVEIRDDSGNVLSDRLVGRVFVLGPCVMRGYFDDPDETAKVIVDGWLDTGDLGYWVGDALVIVGRAKDMMIINGRNVWPQDIEWTVEHMDGLRSGDGAAIVLTNTDGIEIPSILVQCRSSDLKERARIAEEVAARVQEVVGILCDVILVPARSLPKTTSGKLARGRAKTMFESGKIERLDVGPSAS